MDVLVLGGTVLVGRAVVDMALTAGHRVTVLNRGMTAAQPRGAEVLVGDRTGELGVLDGRRFDLILDTGYVPTVVGRTAELLTDSGHYAFVSTVNVFPSWPDHADYHERGTHDGDPDAAEAPPGLDESQRYGWLKVGCERAVQRVFGERRSTILRGALLVGPYDSAVGRLPWWLARIRRSGQVLVPGSPEDDFCALDVRDLAELALSMPGGVHECAGRVTTRGELMRTCRSTVASAAQFVWVDDDWALAQGLEMWTEVPLWAPHSPGAWAAHRPSPQLRTRPLAQTVMDTWAWQRSLPSWTPTGRAPGIDPDKERVLVQKWFTEQEQT